MSLIINILNGIIPIVFAMMIGYILAWRNKINSEHQKDMLALTFNVFLPLSTIYNLGRKHIYADDLLVIISCYISVLIITPVMIGLTFCLYKTRRMYGFAQLFTTTFITNIIITGIYIT